MTNSWTDIQNTDLAIIMGGNAAEAHPCGFKMGHGGESQSWRQADRGRPALHALRLSVGFLRADPPGQRIAFLLGVINYCIQNDKVQWEYVKAFTNAPYLVREGFGYADGLFTGYDEPSRDYNRFDLGLCLGPDGDAISDDTLRASAQRMAAVEETCVDVHAGAGRAHLWHAEREFLKVCEMMGECSSKTKTMTSMYALGWTQHSKGSQNIRTMAMLQLILGNIGVRGGGMNALRGHSNI